MNEKKLTIEDFNQIRQTMQNIWQQAEDAEELDEYDRIIENLESRYESLMGELFSYDLSDIPYEAYRGLILVGNVDFSNTHANIDFNILNTEDMDSINVKGCNVRNLEGMNVRLLNEDSFDENVIKSNPSIFLSSSIPKAFRDKYYHYSLSIEDFMPLTEEEIKEVNRKGNEKLTFQSREHFFRADEQSAQMIEMLGLENAVHLYKDYNDDYREISTLFHLNSNYNLGNTTFQDYGITDIDVSENLRKSDVSDLRQTLYKEIRKKILSSWAPLQVEQFTPQFLEENEDIFLLHHSLPEEVRESYYSKSLSYEELSDNIGTFKDSPYISFISRGSVFKNFIQKIGMDDFTYLLEHYKDVTDYLEKTNHLIKLQDYNSTNIREQFPQIVAIYLYDTNPNLVVNDIMNLPEWVKSINYKIVPRYQNIDDLVTYDNQTLIADRGQQRFLYMLGSNSKQRLKRFKSLFEFENKYHFFQNYSNSFYGDFGSIISKIGRGTSNELLVKCQSYPTFTDFFFDYLDKQRSSYGIRYEKLLDEKATVDYSYLFISKDCPQELQDDFYTNQITPEILKKYQNYIPKLVGKNFTIHSRFRNVRYTYLSKTIDANGILANRIGQEQFLNLVATYGSFSVFLNEKSDALTQEELVKELGNEIYRNVVQEKIIYKELKEVSSFNSSYPQLFLDEKVPKNIQDVFYRREINMDVIKNTPDLLDYFHDTNIAFGLENHGEFLSGLYPEVEIIEANRRKLYIFKALQKVDSDKETLKTIENYIKNHEYNEEKIDGVVKLAERAVHSNSKDIRTLSGSIITSVVNLENPEESFEKIESVFTKNNLPFFVKVYSCFQILNPNLDNFDFSSTSRVAPELKDDSLPMVGLGKTPNERRFQIIYNDILRITYNSNNRDFQAYLDNLEFGNTCYNQIVQGQFDISKLTKEEKKEVSSFALYLETLYKNTRVGQQYAIDFDSLSLDKKVKILGDFFSPNEKYQLKDRIVRSFCFFSGITSFNQLKSLTDNIHKEADRRGRSYAKQLQQGPFHFEVGDFVRGIGDYDILGSTLQHGNVSKEFLTTFVGEKTKSDTTPLDVDLTYVDKEMDIFHTVSDSPTGFGFGNLFIILKHDNPNINITRDKDGNLTGNSYDPMKIEVFGTETYLGGYETHWGARTGFSFSDVDYILYKKKNRINEENPYDVNGNVQYLPLNNDKPVYDDLSAIKFEIARNGVYIPVIDFSGKLIYSEQEYDNLRSKMQGLSYYGLNEYTMSSNLRDEGIEQIVQTIPLIERDNAIKRQAIDNVIDDALSSLGITLKGEIDHKLETGTAEFIDTGSTGRNTNILGKGDFDFIMRLDNSIMTDDKKKTEVKERLLQALGEEHRNEIVDGNFRFKNVHIDGLKEPIDIDISFIQKTDKMDYSSDESLRDRLCSIKEQYPEDYSFVLANIIDAKEVLKEGEVYKKQQGGIGGIGIENWILQNGGSFQDAATSFLETAQGKTLSEFQTAYPIWDFGENHYADEKGFYKYDNFISNLTEEGYTKMQQQLSNYLEKRNSKNELKVMVGENSMGQVMTQTSTVTL